MSTGTVEKVRHAGHDNRFSPFGSLVSDGRALRELESAAFTERWIDSPKGAVFQINEWFDQTDNNFLAIREAAAIKPSPHRAAYYDQLMLKLYRNQTANELLLISRPQYREFIQDRAKKPLSLPELTQHLDKWDRLVDEAIKGRCA